MEQQPPFDSLNNSTDLLKDSGRTPRSADEVQLDIDRTRSAFDNIEQFRAGLSADNTSGHDLVLRTVVELELRLEGLLKEATSVLPDALIHAPPDTGS